MSPVVTPGLGSYDPDDVTFLLQEMDTSGLELDAETREGLMQGGGHYAETLPIEYQPSAEYEAIFEELLARQADRIALLTAVLARRIADEFHPEPVLVSLARAGTPVGVLLRRALRRLGVDAPHFSVSIVRDRGIDPQAMRWLAERHDPARMVFVDGWTGKGAIQRELRVALAELHEQGGPRIAAVLAVLADPGHVADLTATRVDELIPSACLNSTVSGLISRTIVRPDLLGPDAFHGVRVYREFADRDVSRRYVDTIDALLPGPGPRLDAAIAEARAAAPADGRGWRVTEAVAAAHGVSDLNRIKPGIGEATRVLLRRVPRLLLVDPTREEDLRHVLRLAEDRGVEVREHDEHVYACFGLIEDRSGS